MVDLYPASIHRKPVMSSPMYLSLSQSLKLALDPPECSAHSRTTASKSLQAVAALEEREFKIRKLDALAFYGLR